MHTWCLVMCYVEHGTCLRHHDMSTHVCYPYVVVVRADAVLAFFFSSPRGVCAGLAVRELDADGAADGALDAAGVVCFETAAEGGLDARYSSGRGGQYA